MRKLNNSIFRWLYLRGFGAEESPKDVYYMGKRNIYIDVFPDGLVRVWQKKPEELLDEFRTKTLDDFTYRFRRVLIARFAKPENILREVLKETTKEGTVIKNFKL